MSKVMNQKILSVSIAAYNVEAYLARALESCIVPNMDKLEVIVVDDGSTDGTAKIVQSYVKRYPKTFRLVSKENGGYGSTVNTSLPIAQGKYFKLLDGDDWFDSAGLQHHLDILDGADVDMVVTPRWDVWSRQGKEQRRLFDCVDYADTGVHQCDDFFAQRRIGMHAITFKTDILRKADFALPHNCLYTDNLYCAYGMYEVRQLMIDRTPLYTYFLGRVEQSKSAASVVSHYKEHESVLWSLIALYEKKMNSDRVSNLAKSCELKRILEECGDQYRFLTLLKPKVRALRELRSFDQRTKRRSPRIYRLTAKNSKQVRILRSTAFITLLPFSILNERHLTGA